MKRSHHAPWKLCWNNSAERNLLAMGSNLRAMASTLEAMTSNLAGKRKLGSYVAKKNCRPPHAASLVLDHENPSHEIWGLTHTDRPGILSMTKWSLSAATWCSKTNRTVRWLIRSLIGCAMETDRLQEYFETLLPSCSLGTCSSTGCPLGTTVPNEKIDAQPVMLKSPWRIRWAWPILQRPTWDLFHVLRAKERLILLILLNSCF